MFISSLRAKWTLVLVANLIVIGGIICYWFGGLSVIPDSIPQISETPPPQENIQITQQPSHTVTVTVQVTPTSSSTELTSIKHCDPYQEPGYFDITDKVHSNMKYISLNPSCQPMASNIVNRIKEKDSIPELLNKTMIFIGDSVDRFHIDRLCSSTLSNEFKTYQDDHNHIWNTTDKVPNSFPRVCNNDIYNFTVVNYFIYGFDLQGVWADRKKVFPEPFKWRDRVDLSLNAYQTLNRGDPHVAFIGISLWELARFDILSKLANDTEVISFNETQLNEYRDNLVELITTLRQRMPQTRLVFRESHFPKSNPNRFDGDKLPRTYRFSAQKVSQLNRIASEVMTKMKAEYWPVGELTQNMPKEQILQDIVHPSGTALELIWVPGVFEYLMRTTLNYQVL
ncbi:uncharacterized protein SAPINGB_P002544 [Magnusiomyces paraingens]|uniref:Uncharacterized protein n=1 Tax=Magnusiomyces paraingens TaxID=2606893 RepID=A0A5E8BK84_9ASCO|nr:uncharacterized protein SAPINGB_P002544 [Saprochaete ingens]VVT49987.1 unnamed protein product [Saprochaete ingens]